MNLLFITSTRVGDAVLSTGLLDHLIRRHPGIRVTVACGEAATALFAAVPGLERILPMRKQRRAAHWLRLWLATVPRRWDIVVDLRGSALALLLRAAHRHVWRTQGAEDHRVVQLGQVLGLAEPPAPRIWVDPAHHLAARRLIPEGAPVLALGPTANWRGKQWPVARFAELALRLTAPDGLLPGARIAVFAAPFERAAAAPLLAALPGDRMIDAIDAGDLLTVAAALQLCRFYVGNDSGLMHLAAASGVPTLGLFGPSREQNYAPWGACTGAARTTLPYPQHFYQLDADGGMLDHLMDTLTVDAAWAAALDLGRRSGLDRSPAPPARVAHQGLP